MRGYDVVVVGAGPAGATAARYCAKEGLKTLLLEKYPIPRYKSCAGGITQAALNELDFTLPEPLIERRCYGVRVVCGRVKNSIKCTQTLAYMVNRSTFDAYLVEKAKEAGTKVHDEQTCVAVASHPQHLIVQTDKGDYRANIVIGADGFHSRVLRALRPRFYKEELRFCVFTEIPMPESQILKLLDGLVEIHYGYIDMGYAWMFPKRKHVSAGIGGVPTSAKIFIQRLKSYLKLHGLDNDVRIRGCFLPISRFQHEAYTDRIMLVGDAAGFVNSFSGEGIRYALLSGKLAARTAFKCHAQNRFTADEIKEYQYQCVSNFVEDLVCSARVTDLLFEHPWFFLRIAIITDSILKKYVKTIIGEISFVEYVDWVKARFPLFLIKRLFSSKKIQDEL